MNKETIYIFPSSKYYILGIFLTSVGSGVLQGFPLSPFLFNLLIDTFEELSHICKFRIMDRL